MDKTMNCHKTQENMIPYLDKNLSNETIASFENHICHCHTCQSILQNISETYSAFDNEAKQFPTERFIEQLQNNISKTVNAKTRTFDLTYKLIPIAASFLVLLSICAGVLFGKKLSDTTMMQYEIQANSKMEAFSYDYYLTSYENTDYFLTTK